MTGEGKSASRLFCAGDECLEVWPEGPMPKGWTVENVEGRLEPCCRSCTAFYAGQAAPDMPRCSCGPIALYSEDPARTGPHHYRSCLRYAVAARGETGASECFVCEQQPCHPQCGDWIAPAWRKVDAAGCITGPGDVDIDVDANDE